MTVRLSVWLTARLTTVSRPSRRASRCVSRTRSKTTTVSLTEYPAMVRMAATTFNERSYPNQVRNATVIENVVERGHHRADRETQAESKRDVGQDPANREDRRPQGLPSEIAADRRADQLAVDDRELSEPALPKALLECGRRRIERRVFALEGQPDHDLVVAGGTEPLDLRIGRPAAERRADSIFADRLGELHDDHRAAGEVDAERKAAARDDGDKAREDDKRRQANRLPAPLDEVEIQDYRKCAWRQLRIKCSNAPNRPGASTESTRTTSATRTPR